MRDIPVNLGGYKLMITEAPVMKMREQRDGTTVPAVDNDNVTKFVVSLFAKRRVQAGERPGKGEEIKVTLASDPGEGFDEGTYIELIEATVSPYSFKNDNGETISGISFAARGLTPIG